MTPKIVTHSGSFHADEVLACYMLRILPEYKNAEIARSRDPEVWAKADVLVDVGQVYDPANFKFDHHQRTFNDTFSSNYKTRLSSAGLIYKHFGKRVISEVLADQSKITEQDVDTIHKKLYEDFIECFDGVDNGVSQYPSSVEPNYKDYTSISQLVESLNPLVCEEHTANVFNCFFEAMDICGKFFVRRVRFLGCDWLASKKEVRKALERRREVHPSGHVIAFENFVVWKDIIYEVEYELGISNQILYVTFPGENNSYRIQAVPKCKASFESRKPLPKHWCGLSGQALDDVTKVPGGVFVHATGFIGGHKTFSGAMKLISVALE